MEVVEIWPVLEYEAILDRDNIRSALLQVTCDSYTEVWSKKDWQCKGKIISRFGFDGHVQMKLYKIFVITMYLYHT